MENTLDTTSNKIILAGTGHRKINGNYPPSKEWIFVEKSLLCILKQLNIDKVLTGMAIGFDQLLAKTCLDLKLPYVACLPFLGQERIWPQASKDHFNMLLSKAAEVVIVSEGGYSPQKMQIRNEYMADRADKIIAAWDGSSGGTGNCVKYIQKIGKEIIRIDPRLAI